MPAQAVAALFNQKTLKNSLQSAQFPADFPDRHKIIKTWLNDLRSGKLNTVKEVSLHGQFLTDIFQRILGYRGIVGSDRWELHAEQTIADQGGSTCIFG